MNARTPDGRGDTGPGSEQTAGVGPGPDEAVIDGLRVAPVDTTRLRERLAADAAGAGLVDVAYRMVDSPIGGLLLAATGEGLVYVAFEVESRPEVLEMLATRVGPRVLRVRGARAVDGDGGDTGRPVGGGGGGDAAGPGRILDEATVQIGEYLAGRRRDFTVALDTRLATGFRGQVQRRLADIGYGRTATYKQLAAEIERPGAVRAVGTACATNPLPLVWPCHRILRSDGGLGGYRGGVEAKRRLLAMESAA